MCDAAQTIFNIRLWTAGEQQMEIRAFPDFCRRKMAQQLGSVAALVYRVDHNIHVIEAFNYMLQGLVKRGERRLFATIAMFCIKILQRGWNSFTAICELRDYRSDEILIERQSLFSASAVEIEVRVAGERYHVVQNFDFVDHQSAGLKLSVSGCVSCRKVGTYDRIVLPDPAEPRIINQGEKWFKT